MRTKEELKMIVNFALQIYGLKDVKRTGWNFNPSVGGGTVFIHDEVTIHNKEERTGATAIRSVCYPESVAAHSWSATFLGWLLATGREDLCLDKLIKLLLMHDDPEVKTGDLVLAYLSGEELQEARRKKREGEEAAIAELAAFLPHDLGMKYLMIQADCMAKTSREAMFAKQIDGLDVLIQAIIYAKRGERVRPREFLKSVRPTIKDHELKIVFEILEGMVEELERREGG